MVQITDNAVSAHLLPKRLARIHHFGHGPERLFTQTWQKGYRSTI